MNKSRRWFATTEIDGSQSRSLASRVPNPSVRIEKLPLYIPRIDMCISRYLRFKISCYRSEEYFNAHRSIRAHTPQPHFMSTNTFRMDQFRRTTISQRWNVDKILCRSKWFTIVFSLRSLD